MEFFFLPRLGFCCFCFKCGFRWPGIGQHLGTRSHMHTKSIDDRIELFLGMFWRSRRSSFVLTDSTFRINLITLNFAENHSVNSTASSLLAHTRTGECIITVCTVLCGVVSVDLWPCTLQSNRILKCIFAHGLWIKTATFMWRPITRSIHSFQITFCEPRAHTDVCVLVCRHGQSIRNQTLNHSDWV